MTPAMLAPLVRVLLRYVAGFLAGYGIAVNAAGYVLADDPDVVFLVSCALSGIIGAAIEGFYALAKKYGWST